MIQNKQDQELITNDWKDFEEFISAANRSCNWLVLRNFEYLPNNFFANDKDVDILCENLDLFVNKMKLKKRSWGIAAYETVIDNKVVPFDVRFLGDGYYDKLWQYKMLTNKIYTSDGVPRMSNEDYFYSLIYHSKIQKMEVKEVYKKRLYDLAISINHQNYESISEQDNTYAANLLSEFMEKNFYIFTKPVDVNVPRNSQFFNYLSPYVQKGVVYSTPIKVIILGLIPKFIFRIIPRKIKNILKKYF